MSKDEIVKGVTELSEFGMLCQFNRNILKEAAQLIEQQALELETQTNLLMLCRQARETHVRTIVEQANEIEIYKSADTETLRKHYEDVIDHLKNELDKQAKEIEELKATIPDSFIQSIVECRTSELRTQIEELKKTCLAVGKSAENEFTFLRTQNERLVILLRLAMHSKLSLEQWEEAKALLTEFKQSQPLSPSVQS